MGNHTSKVNLLTNKWPSPVISFNTPANPSPRTSYHPQKTKPWKQNRPPAGLPAVAAPTTFPCRCPRTMSKRGGQASRSGVLGSRPHLALYSRNKVRIWLLLLLNSALVVATWGVSLRLLFLQLNALSKNKPSTPLYKCIAPSTFPLKTTPKVEIQPHLATENVPSAKKTCRITKLRDHK